MAVGPIGQITVVTESGEQVIEATSEEFSVKLDTTGNGTPDTLFSPAITQEVEIENDGDTSKMQDQCGNTERQRQTHEGWSIRVEGIVTEEPREGNLTMAMLRDDVAAANSVQIRCDLINGEVAVNNTVLTQSSDLVSFSSNETDGKEKAFDFQLQLGESESGN